MSNPETHTCGYCQHTWIHGTTGDHNCLANIILQREEAKETLARLRQDLQDPPADVQEAVLDKLKLRDAIPNLTDFLEWNKFAERGMTLLEALTILNNRHLEAVAAVQAQRDLLLEACVNLENDDGSIPASAWNMIQSAVAAAGGTPKEIPEETMREGYALRCRMREIEALARELAHVLGFYHVHYTDAELMTLAKCTTGMGELDPTIAKREVIRRHVINKAQAILP